MLKYLQKNTIVPLDGKDITSLSNFKTKAKTEYYFEINNRQDIDKLSEIYTFAKEKNIKILFIGGGTNLLFAFDIFNGIIIKNNLTGWIYNKNTKILESFSNDYISDIAESLDNNYGQKLWYRFIGLPGTIGGAVYGNAGCFGLETENNFLKAELLNLETGKIEILSKKDMNFSYRSSILKENNNKHHSGTLYFLIKAYFDLSNKVEKYHSDIDNIYFRENKQPKGNTCGSFFKNPNREYSAGYLIEQVGLKGYKIGGAFFSEKHANFLMNDGTGTYKDLINLIDLAKKKVKQEFNIELINEVRIIKN